MEFKRYIIFLFVIFFCFSVFAQDMQYTREIVKTLSSQEFFGRGYVNKGDSIAAAYLKKEFIKIGLNKHGDSFFQQYEISINTIIENPVLKFGDNELQAAKDFVVIPNSPDYDGWIRLCRLDKRMMTNYWGFNHFTKEDKSNCLIFIDTTNLDNPELFTFANLILSQNIFDAQGVLEATERLKYTARTEIADKIHIQIHPEAIDPSADSVFLKIKNEFFEEYRTQNVVGYLEGETDSIIMITAHYDHLGMKGNIIFPGANDNASGVSMVLNLAKYFQKQNQLKHNIFFVLFSGEEAGLLGSRHFANNPPFDLDLVKVLINFDMVGTGESGVSLFNAKEYPEYEKMLVGLNENNNYFNSLSTSFAVYSSDHAPFHQKGVPAMFFYTRGDNSNYHQPEDIYEDVNFYAYRDLYQFVIDFLEIL